MKQLQLRQIQLCALEVLQELDALCRKHSIRYSLCGGTLLGAVRHGGFVPWDDDVDIMMPREDYERFLSVAAQEPTNFYLCVDSGYPFIKVCNRKTRLVEQGVREATLGVFVDVFPLDGAGKSRFGAVLHALRCSFWHGLTVCGNWKNFQPSTRGKWYFEPVRFGFWCLSRLVGGQTARRRLKKCLQKRRFCDSLFAGRLVGDHGLRELFPTKIFSDRVKIRFEGSEFYAIASYDTFLRRLYGDYQTLPSPHKRISRHRLTAFWVNENESIDHQP